MQLHFRGLSTRVLEVAESDTIADVKRRLLELEGLQGFEDLTFACQGSLVEDESIVTDLAITTLDVNVPVPGGKVHGSLARAGKVKGQTPRVEKAEKKKKKTGRAKRRIQYNRRFVNIVQAFGRRRGPNANS